MNTINQLKIKRERLIAELREVDTLVAEFEALGIRLRRVLGEAEPIPSDLDISDPQILQKRADSPRRPQKNEVAQFEREVRAILGEATKPLDRAELLSLVTARGVVVGGKDPKNTLSSRLSRMSGVSSDRGYGYWLTDRGRELLGLPASVLSYGAAPDLDQSNEVLGIEDE